MYSFVSLLCSIYVFSFSLLFSIYVLCFHLLCEYLCTFFCLLCQYLTLSFRFLLQFVDSRGESQWKGFLLAVGLFVVAELDSLCIQRYLYHTYNFGMRFRTIITAAVYRKVRILQLLSVHFTAHITMNKQCVESQLSIKFPAIMF